MPPISSTNRVPEVEVLRGLAIVAVVGIHVSWYLLAPSGVSNAAGKLVAAVHLLNGYGVPLFLTLSAVGLSLRYSQPVGVSAHLDFLWQRAVRLLPAYLVWSLISAALFLPDALTSVRGVAEILLAGRADFHFYFIPLLFETYVLWPVLRPLAGISARSGQAALFVAAAGAAVSVGWWELSSRSLAPRSFLWMPMFWLCYVTLGIAAAAHVDAIRRAARSAAVLLLAAAAATLTALGMCTNLFAQSDTLRDSTALTYAVTIFQNPSAAYIFSAITLLALLSTKLASLGNAASWLTHLSRYAYGIFLVHLLILRIVVHRLIPPSSLAETGSVAALAKTLASWALCLVLSLALVRLLAASRRTRRFVSNAP